MHMRKKLTETIILVTIFLISILPVMAGREIVPADVTVKVQYQLKMDGYNSWTTTNASLRGAVTESIYDDQPACCQTSKRTDSHPVCLLWQDCCPYCPLPDEAWKVCLDERKRYVEQRPD